MDVIRVDTSDLRNGSQSLGNAAEEIAVVQGHVADLTSRVSDNYDGQFRKALEGILREDFYSGALLRSRALDLGEELLRRATGFDTANEFGKSAMLAVAVDYVSLVEKSPLLKLLSNLRSIELKASMIWNMVGAGFSGLAALLFVKTAPQIPTSLPGPFAPSTTFEDLLEKNDATKHPSQETWLDRSKIVDITTQTPLYDSRLGTGNYRKGRNESVDAIVIHSTGSSTASSAISTLQNSKNRVSAHYVVDKDGTIYQLVDETNTAFHATWYNDKSVGIEVVQAKLEKPTEEYFYEPYTEAQLVATKKLVLDICKRNNISPESIVSHQIVDRMAREAGLPRPNWSGKVDGNEALEQLRQYVERNL